MSRKKKESAGRPCSFCARPMRQNKNSIPPEEWYKQDWATTDHIITQRAGGTNDPYNLHIVCARCNGLRGHIDFEVFAEFARIVIKPYPSTPTPVLRLALNDFLHHLAVVAFSQKKHVRNAFRVTLLAHADKLVKSED